MNLNKILEELRRDREQIDEAILSLERLAAGSGPRRGRPPAWLKAQKTKVRPQAGAKEQPATKTASGD
ncbi:MAG TPA: hypothetical protein VNH83_25855 [Bryobacteraceae bacterium]|jgi:hypothetical protein|nr:hypothetical protein [Bryobacteraceae bacterium]